MWDSQQLPQGEAVAIDNCSKPAIVHADGMVLSGNDGKHINVKSLVLENGKMILASKYGQASDERFDLEFSPDELKLQETLKVVPSLRFF